MPSRYTSPARTLASLNSRLLDSLPIDMFITAFYAVLDPVTGALVYANAGHEPPIVASGRDLVDLTHAGLPVGMWQAGEYEDRTLRMSPGDLLFVYSDGLTDHRISAHERLSRDRVVALMARGAESPCEDLVRMIVRETVGDGVPSDDDVTLLALRYRGAPHR